MEEREGMSKCCSGESRCDQFDTLAHIFEEERRSLGC